MNVFKTVIALLAFGFATLFVQSPNWSQLNSSQTLAVGCLLLSGFMGLGISDTFIFKSFTRIGTTRAFVVFRFQPVFIAFGAWIYLSQPLSMNQGIGMLLLVSCVILLSIEELRSGSWGFHGTLYALTAALLDAIGVVLTRFAFDHWAELHMFHANLIRVVGGLVSFFFIARFEPIQLWPRFKALPPSLKTLSIVAGFFGTFVALYLWLKAVSIGHLATVSAVGGLGPLFVLVFETLMYRQWPSRYVWAAVTISILGMLFIVNP